MTEESLALSAYRGALIDYFKTANNVVAVMDEMHAAEAASVNSLKALFSELGYADEQGRPIVEPRKAVQLQVAESQRALDELGWGPDHPVAQSVARRFQALEMQVEMFEQNERELSNGQPHIDGPVI